MLFAEATEWCTLLRGQLVKIMNSISIYGTQRPALQSGIARRGERDLESKYAW